MRWPGRVPVPYSFDVRTDSRGEYFDLAVSNDRVDFHLLQSNRSEQHLLLLASDRQRFLCGHDERHWFIAGIADRVSTVREAKLSLMPAQISEQVKRFSPDEINNRNNAVFKRQGEWFFVPLQEQIFPRFVLKNEPLQRGGRSKPHVCQELCREGGELVYLVRGRVLTEGDYLKRKRSNPDFAGGQVQTRTRNPKVYVRGYVRHSDHATLWLDQWHRVYLNVESSSGMNMFLD